MHGRALARILDDYRSRHEAAESAKNAEVQRQKRSARNTENRKSRRTSMARQHRRLSQITTKTPSFRLQDDASSTQVIQEALEHLADLENAQLLEGELAERGRQLIGSNDEKAILAILKNAHDDLALSTYLKYRRTPRVLEVRVLIVLVCLDF